MQICSTDIEKLGAVHATSSFTLHSSYRLTNTQAPFPENWVTLQISCSQHHRSKSCLHPQCARPQDPNYIKRSSLGTCPLELTKSFGILYCFIFHNVCPDISEGSSRRSSYKGQNFCLSTRDFPPSETVCGRISTLVLLKRGNAPPHSTRTRISGIYILNSQFASSESL